MKAVYFEHRVTGEEVIIEVDDYKASVAEALSQSAMDLTAADPTLTDAQVSKILEVMYTGMAWWDTETLMLD